jgi:Protein of unknown function (DUF2911)
MNRFRYMLAAFVMLAAIAVLVEPSAAQQKKGPASPHDKVNTRIGGKLITVYYGRPNAKGRKIWGGLVPYGKAWRAGADEATTLITEDAITIGDAAVPAGAYTLYMVPQETGASKLAISKRLGDWGILKDGTVNEKSDIARVDMKKDALKDKLEQFTIAFEKGKDGATLKMMWEDAEFSVPVTAQKK